MSSPARPDATSVLRFAEKLITLLDQGGFVATYKFAVLIALMDLCLEKSARDGSPPESVTTRQLARKIIEIYWSHTEPFDAGVAERPPEVLRQNSGKQAQIVTLIQRFRGRRHVHGSSGSLHRHRTDHPAAFDRLEREVEWTLVKMPLPKLQRIGRETDDFLYRIGWGDDVTRTSFLDGTRFDNVIRFQPGASEALVALAGVLRPLVHRQWAAMVTRYNGLADAQLESFLFGCPRTSLAPITAPLLELQRGTCFYCLRQIRADAQVDHFLPWARHPDDGIENLVVAHAACNQAKSDFLAAARHVQSWSRRVDESAEQLRRIASTAAWPREPERTVNVARAVYARLPYDARLWSAGRQFEPMDRAAITEVFGRMQGAI